MREISKDILEKLSAELPGLSDDERAIGFACMDGRFEEKKVGDTSKLNLTLYFDEKTEQNGAKAYHPEDGYVAVSYVIEFDAKRKLSRFLKVAQCYNNNIGGIFCRSGTLQSYVAKLKGMNPDTAKSFIDVAKQLLATQVPPAEDDIILREEEPSSPETLTPGQTYNFKDGQVQLEIRADKSPHAAGAATGSPEPDHLVLGVIKRISGRLGVEYVFAVDGQKQESINLTQRDNKVILVNISKLEAGDHKATITLSNGKPIVIPFKIKEEHIRDLRAHQSKAGKPTGTKDSDVAVIEKSISPPPPPSPPEEPEETEVSGMIDGNSVTTLALGRTYHFKNNQLGYNFILNTHSGAEFLAHDEEQRGVSWVSFFDNNYGKKTVSIIIHVDGKQVYPYDLRSNNEQELTVIEKHTSAGKHVLTIELPGGVKKKLEIMMPTLDVAALLEADKAPPLNVTAEQKSVQKLLERSEAAQEFQLKTGESRELILSGTKKVKVTALDEGARKTLSSISSDVTPLYLNNIGSGAISYQILFGNQEISRSQLESNMKKPLALKIPKERVKAGRNTVKIIFPESGHTILFVFEVTAEDLRRGQTASSASSGSEGSSHLDQALKGLTAGTKGVSDVDEGARGSSSADEKVLGIGALDTRRGVGDIKLDSPPPASERQGTEARRKRGPVVVPDRIHPTNGLPMVKRQDGALVYVFLDKKQESQFDDIMTRIDSEYQPRLEALATSYSKTGGRISFGSYTIRIFNDGSTPRARVNDFRVMDADPGEEEEVLQKKVLTAKKALENALSSFPWPIPAWEEELDVTLQYAKNTGVSFER